MPISELLGSALLRALTKAGTEVSGNPLAIEPGYTQELDLTNTHIGLFNSGTEISVTGYARVACAALFGDPSYDGGSGLTSVTNTGAIEFGTLNAGSADSYRILVSDTGPEYLAEPSPADFPSQSWSTGDTVRFAAGGLTISI